MKQSSRRTRTQELYAERSIRNKDDLLDFIEAIDEDEGIRLEGNLDNHPRGGFIFIGFYRGSYCVNICDKLWDPEVRKYVAGANDEWYYLDTAKEAYDFVLKQARHPLRAWLY